MKSTRAKIQSFLSEDIWVYLSRKGKKALHQQIAEMVKLARYYKYPPYQYIKHDLYLKSFEGDILDCIPPKMVEAYCRSINPKFARVNVIDKKRFAMLLEREGLAVILDLAIITPDGGIITRNNQRVSFMEFVHLLIGLGHSRVFLKPTGGGQGRGTFVAEILEDGFQIAGQSLYEKDFADFIFRECVCETYLVQPLIRQHSLLQQINPTSVNTVRIDTLVLDDGVHYNGAILRMGVGDIWVDNWAAGGLIVNIDLNTGELGMMAKSKAEFGRRIVREHPVTRFRFEGRRLPYWQEIKILVARAAIKLLPLRALGWDVAIQETGPTLVEANHDYDIFLLQDGVGGLRKTRLGQELLCGLKR